MDMHNCRTKFKKIFLENRKFYYRATVTKIYLISFSYFERFQTLAGKATNCVLKKNINSIGERT